MRLAVATKPDEHVDPWGPVLEAQVRTYRAIVDYGAAIDVAIDFTPELTPEKIDEICSDLCRRVDRAFAVPAIRSHDLRPRRGWLRVVREFAT